MTTIGWVCPHCGKAYAPWVAECRCEKTVGATGANVSLTGRIVLDPFVTRGDYLPCNAVSKGGVRCEKNLSHDGPHGADPVVVWETEWKRYFDPTASTSAATPAGQTRTLPVKHPHTGERI